VTLFQVIYHHYWTVHRAGVTLLSLVAEAGGEKSDFFSRVLLSPAMRLLKYPKRNDDVPLGALLPGRKSN
jgi:hypothetical protein